VLVLDTLAGLAAGRLGHVGPGRGAPTPD
jgi:hypothetical protein